MTEDLQGKNARLRNKITQLLESHPELETVVNDVALKQPANPSLEQIQANLQERARAIIESRPDLEDSSRTDGRRLARAGQRRHLDCRARRASRRGWQRRLRNRRKLSAGATTSVGTSMGIYSRVATISRSWRGPSGGFCPSRAHLAAQRCDRSAGCSLLRPK